MNKKKSIDKFLLGTFFGIGLSTIVYLIFDSVIKTDYRYVASPVIAFLALCLAMYSAYKVTKWTDSKINESMYKTVDEIMDYEADIKHYITRSITYIKRLDKNTDDFQIERSLKMIKRLAIKSKEKAELIKIKRHKLDRIYYEAKNKKGTEKIPNMNNIRKGVNGLLRLSRILEDENSRNYIINNFSNNTIQSNDKNIKNFHEEYKNILDFKKEEQASMTEYFIY